MTESESDYQGLRVAAFESRRAEATSRLIERSGGQPHVSPSMREVPLADQSEAIEFAKQLLTGSIELVIFLTGVGFEYLLATVAQQVDRDRYLTSLADILTVARGPKTLKAMRDVGLKPTHVVPEPNTWRDVLGVLDAHLAISNLKTGLQEYGKTNPSLIAGLEARGAQVVRIPVYRWDFPTDTSQLESNVRAIAQGERDVILFTSAHQVTNALAMATQLGIHDDVRQQLNRAILCSIGPTTSEALRLAKLAVDFEPSHPKLGHLVPRSGRHLPRSHTTQT